MWEQYKDTESRMEELIGHTWQIAELKELGKLEENRELIQLSFNSVVNDARKEFVDCGIWLDINDVEIPDFRFKAGRTPQEPK